jgi:hypothetical protein
MPHTLALEEAVGPSCDGRQISHVGYDMGDLRGGTGRESRKKKPDLVHLLVYYLK